MSGEQPAAILEGYKAIADHIQARFGLTYSHKTVRSWKYRYALPVVRARKPVRVPADVLDAWFEKTMLGQTKAR